MASPDYGGIITRLKSTVGEERRFTLNNVDLSIKLFSVLTYKTIEGETHVAIKKCP